MHVNAVLNLLRTGLSGAIILTALLLLYYHLKIRRAEQVRRLNAGRISKAEHEAMMGKEVRGMSHYRSRVARMESRMKRYQTVMRTGGLVLTGIAIALAVLELYLQLMARQT